MSAGAQNCIPRTSLVRLCPILEREMREAQIRRERRTAQSALEALKSSEERFRRAALMSTDLIHECDRANNRMHWFGDVDRILGYASGEFPRTVEAWQKIIHAEDQPRIAAAAARHFDSGEPFFEEYRVVKRDGSILHWHHSATLAAGRGRPADALHRHGDRRRPAGGRSKRPSGSRRSGTGRSSSATSPAYTGRRSRAASSTATSRSPASSATPPAKKFSSRPPGTST